jgi:hypothetical protein
MLPLLAQWTATEVGTLVTAIFGGLIGLAGAVGAAFSTYTAAKIKAQADAQQAQLASQDQRIGRVNQIAAQALAQSPPIGTATPFVIQAPPPDDGPGTAGVPVLPSKPPPTRPTITPGSAAVASAPRPQRLQH